LDEPIIQIVFVLVGRRDTDLLNAYVSRDLEDAKKKLREKMKEAEKYIREEYYIGASKKDFKKEVNIWIDEEEMAAGIESGVVFFEFEIQEKRF
jgi:hypothetical protein